jgi:hypothetical protein
MRPAPGGVQLRIHSLSPPVLYYLGRQVWGQERQLSQTGEGSKTTYAQVTEKLWTVHGLPALSTVVKVMGR